MPTNWPCRTEHEQAHVLPWSNAAVKKTTTLDANKKESTEEKTSRFLPQNATDSDGVLQKPAQWTLDGACSEKPAMYSKMVFTKLESMLGWHDW